MKKEWMEPVVEVQEFAANEYVAACGDSGKVYKFVCDAGQYGHNYNVYYYDGSGQKKYIAKEGSWGGWGSQAQFSGYHPCNKTHEAESDSGFISGLLYYQIRHQYLGNRQILIFPLNNNFSNHSKRIEPTRFDPLLYLLIIGSSNHFFRRNLYELHGRRFHLRAFFSPESAPAAHSYYRRA